MTTTYDIAGHELHVLRRGSGDPLLLVQGMSGSHLSWGDPFLSRLEDGLDCVTYDHRGIGLSSAVSAGFSIAELADDAVGVLDALELSSAHVMGISMGGMVAQEIALCHPDRVRTLTLGCTYCGGPQARLADPSVITRLTEAMMSGDRERAIRIGFEVNVSAAFAAEESNFASFREMALAHPAAVQVIMLQMQAIASHDTSGRLGEITAPTLVVHGTEDQMLPVSNGELIASLIPGARLEILEGIGHMFWWEQPERSAQILREHTGAGVAA